jgi:hypothetical protein
MLANNEQNVECFPKRYIMRASLLGGADRVKKQSIFAEVKTD